MTEQRETFYRLLDEHLGNISEHKRTNDCISQGTYNNFVNALQIEKGKSVLMEDNLSFGRNLFLN